MRWRLLDGPFFDNQVATLTLEGRAASMRLEKTRTDGGQGKERLELSFERRLAPSGEDRPQVLGEGRQDVHDLADGDVPPEHRGGGADGEGGLGLSAEQGSGRDT
jgi:hypothetical protein